MYATNAEKTTSDDLHSFSGGIYQKNLKKILKKILGNIFEKMFEKMFEIFLENNI
jgi:hypothetical protein